jgi:hypothetical protein
MEGLLALTDPKDTLAYHGSRILCTHRDMSKVPCKAVAYAMQAYMKGDQHADTVPESEALWFYGMNHGVALIAAQRAPLEPLDPWENNFLMAYHTQMAQKAVRAFYYLVWICTREARHNHSLEKDLPKIGELFGEPMQKFLTGIKGGEAGISKKFLEAPPDATIGVYCDALRWTFYHSKWGGGYGGKAWGKVTDCLCRFVSGEFTAEMMLDTIWTLCHNNGPIFNKGQFYACYESDYVVKRILDIQRSGQIPEAVLHDDKCKGFAHNNLSELMSQLNARFPGKIGDYVDWMKVEALGSVQKYAQDIAAQHKKYGMTPEQKASIAKAEAEAAAIKKAKEEAEAKKAAEHAKTWFQVMPGLEVKKVQRAA